jgi:alpha-1,2-mannosyltransferase
VLVKTLNRLTDALEPLHEHQLFLVVAGSLFMASRFLIRDMPECGVNLALVALSWLAVACWIGRRDHAGGWLLGLAISLKCTPALFWAWFLWKRQWKIAGTTMLAAGVFTLSPMLFMGPISYAHTMREWTGNVWRGVGETRPAYGVLGDEPLQNFSLRPALARYLTVLPEGHRSRLDHPYYLDALNLPAFAAGWIIKAILLGVVLGVAYLFRRPVIARDHPVWLWEAATISVLILLLSPITWSQHCVGVLPAFYLLMRRRVAGKSLPAWTRAVLWVFIVGMLVLNRELVGRDLSYLIQSYRLPTLCLLGVLAVMLRLRAMAAEECKELAWESLPVRSQPAPSPAPRELPAFQ